MSRKGAKGIQVVGLVAIGTLLLGGSVALFVGVARKLSIGLGGSFEGAVLLIAGVVSGLGVCFGIWHIKRALVGR